MEQYKDEQAFLEAEGIENGQWVTFIDDHQQPEKLRDVLFKYKAYLIEQAKGDKMTLQQCKDEVAKKKGWYDWANLCFVWAGFISQIDPFMNEAVEMYANQFIPVAPAEEWKPIDRTIKDDQRPVCCVKYANIDGVRDWQQPCKCEDKVSGCEMDIKEPSKGWE